MRCSRSLLLGILSLCISLVRAHITDHEDFDAPLSASQGSFPEHITLQQWPLDAARPSPLGRIAYDPQTKQGKYFALGQSVGSKVHGSVRVGMQVANGEWFGTVVDAVCYCLLPFILYSIELARFCFCPGGDMWTDQSPSFGKTDRKRLTQQDITPKSLSMSTGLGRSFTWNSRRRIRYAYSPFGGLSSFLLFHRTAWK